jgi:hypothetical protein
VAADVAGQPMIALLQVVTVAMIAETRPHSIALWPHSVTSPRFPKRVGTESNLRVVSQGNRIDDYCLSAVM